MNRVKEIKTRSIKAFNIPIISELKDGQSYYIKNQYDKAMTHEFIFDLTYHTKINNKSRYISDIGKQISSGLIYIKK